MKGAQQGDDYCEHIVAVRFLDGCGVEQNLDTALEWFMKGVSKGDGTALWGVGEVHAAKSQYKEAFEWYMKAAAQGDSDGEYRLGFCYELGQYVAKDIPKAIEWYTRAAKKGHNDAKEALGELGQPAP
jgi:TPR repeat protein